jgi:hypothetical protein
LIQTGENGVNAFDILRSSELTVVESSPALRLFEIYVRRAQTTRHPPRLYLPWAGLTNLRLQGEITLAGAHRILSQCKSLETCRLVIYSGPTQGSLVSAANTTFLKLRCLKLHFEIGAWFGVLLSRLTLPTLASLKLTTFERRAAFPTREISSLIDRSACTLQSFSNTFHIPDPGLGEPLALMHSFPSSTSPAILIFVDVGPFQHVPPSVVQKMG